MADALRQGSHCAGDKTGVRYWDNVYNGWNALIFEPHRKGLRYLGRRRWHALFNRAFNRHAPQRGRLIEVGCGGSQYLPYFAKEFGFVVSGIDYSGQGCALAERNLELARVGGTIYNGDLFSLPQELIEIFDVAVSFGLVEHFSVTDNCVAQIARLLRPGGLIITTAPNMAGLTGLAQKFFNRNVYDKHVSLSVASLSAAHAKSGLEVLEEGYLEFMNFGVINAGGTTSAGLSRSMRISIHKALLGVTLGAWALETLFGPWRGNPFSSPYVYCIARRPE